MMKIKVGDLVGRKSYNCDIIFKVYNIENNEEGDNIALLRGVNVRLLADSPESDLIHVSKDDVSRNDEILASKMRYMLRASIEK